MKGVYQFVTLEQNSGTNDEEKRKRFSDATDWCSRVSIKKQMNQLFLMKERGIYHGRKNENSSYVRNWKNGF